MKGQEEDFVIEINSPIDISKSRMKSEKEATKKQKQKRKKDESTKAVATNLITNKYFLNIGDLFLDKIFQGQKHV